MQKSTVLEDNKGRSWLVRVTAKSGRCSYMRKWHEEEKEDGDDDDDYQQFQVTNLCGNRR